MSDLKFTLSDVTLFLPDNLSGLLKKLYLGLYNVIFNKSVTKFLTVLKKCVLANLNPTSYLKSSVNKRLHSTLKHDQLYTEAVAQRCSVKKVFLKISQNEKRYLRNF